jgi:hypothetical protein
MSDEVNKISLDSAVEFSLRQPRYDQVSVCGI